MQSYSYAGSAFESWVEQWTVKLQDAQKRVTRRSVPGWLAIILGVTALCLFAALVQDYAWIGILVMLIGVTVGVVLLVLAGQARKAIVPELSEEIQQTCQAQGLDREKVVSALYEKTGGGKVRDEVLRTVDPDMMGRIGAKVKGDAALKQVFEHKIEPLKISVNASSGSVTSVTIQGEADVDRFASVAVDYLAHKGYAEGMAALAMVQMLYGEIAPPGSELFVKFAQTNQALRDVAISAQKIFSGFDLKPEIKSVKESVAKRRTQTLIEMLLLAQSQQTGLEEIATAMNMRIGDLRVRDEAFVGSCIDYIGKRAAEGLLTHVRAYELLALIPDSRTLPYLLDSFKLIPFFPQGIEAMAFLGEEVHARLIDAMQTGSGSLRFNAALALGFMKVESARGALARTLPQITDPIEGIGIRYALLRLGGTKHMEALVGFLNHADPKVRHCAAIALEHLEEPLDDAVFLRHLDNSEKLVRLRLTRKLGTQAPQDPALIEALLGRFDDGDEDVRAAAVTAVGGLPAERVYNRVAYLAQNGTARIRLCAYEVLGKLEQPAAIPLLTTALGSTRDNDICRAAISALGELGAVAMAPQIATYLQNEQLEGAAFWALLRISMKDKQAGVQPFEGRSQYRLKRSFLLALHGDEGAKAEIKGQLRSGVDLMNLVQAMEYAQILREPDFEPAFRKLLTYRQPTRFPGDRYVSHIALKALVNIQLAKAL